MKRMTILPFLLITILAGSVPAENPRDMRFPELTFEPAEPVRFETDNGMVVYFLEYHELPVVAVTAYFKGGDVHDRADKVGLTGLTARLMRTGGAGDRTADQIDEDLDYVGANVGSHSSQDHLSASMNSLMKDLDLTCGIYADVLMRPAFDTEKMALEVSNIQDGIRRQNDSSWSISRRVFYQTLYNDHPYGQFATLESMGNINRSDLVAQHEKFYSPDNCIMSITGDMTLAEARRMVDRHFGSWRRAGIRIEPIADAAAVYTPGVYYAEKDINQANIRMGHLGLDNKHPDRFAMEVMNYALGGGGFSSRMTSRVRTTAGLAYSVGTYHGTRPHNGVFFGYCLTRAEAMSEALQMMLDIINEVRTTGITKEEMEQAKESILNSYVFNYDTPGELVAARARLELRGFPPDQMMRTLESYKAITLEDCNRVAREYIDIGKMVIVVTGDRNQFDKAPDIFGPTTAVSMEIK